MFDTYWRFAVERQAVFFRKLKGETGPLTADPILRTYKFTNAYRAADRVSQYLIRQVIYGGPQTVRDVFLRTILFKVFNKVETWELLEDAVGPIDASTFSRERYARVLDQAMESGERIYSAAYIMASAKSAFGHRRKHQNHLQMIEMMMEDGLPERIQQASSMEEVYRALLDYPSIGPFLAYQYATDLNYGPFTDFPEDGFVEPGPGALDGIAKCFADLGDYDERSVIRWTMDRQEEEFAFRDLNFQTLWGRPLQLIDCQNLYCEISKYARVYHPEVEDPRGRTRIKQRYDPSSKRLRVWFPPKWGLNDRIPDQVRAVGP